ncbi:MAG UNVERIFIED_CONTAM: tyrosine-type recombinase/integrase, partial [Thermobifida fusca]
RILGDRYHDGNLVFCRPDGRRYHLESISGRQFQQLQEKAKVPRIRFHDLRHTHATWMLMNVEHPKVVSERLGHTTPTLFMTTYSHVIPEMDRAAADRLDALLPNLHQMLRATKRDKTPPNASRENEEAHRQIS